MSKAELLKAELPVPPSEFESLVKKQCWDAHEILKKTFVSSTDKIIRKPLKFLVIHPVGEKNWRINQEIFVFPGGFRDVPRSSSTRRRSGST